MRTVQATQTAVSIWVTREDMPTKGQLLALVRQALSERGLDPWPSTEAECFTAGGDALIIARPGHERQCGFYFPDLEPLLDAVAATADGESALYSAAGGYVLAVAPEAAGPALWEYGESFQLDEAWEAHAREQGLCLMPEGAIGGLRRCFLR